MTDEQLARRIAAGDSIWHELVETESALKKVPYDESVYITRALFIRLKLRAGKMGFVQVKGIIGRIIPSMGNLYKFHRWPG